MTIPLKDFHAAQALAKAALTKFYTRAGWIPTDYVAHLLTQSLLEEIAGGKALEPPVSDIEQIPVVGGAFDGDRAPATTMHRIVRTPGGLLSHYELVYWSRGNVTQEQAEKIIGKPLD